MFSYKALAGQKGTLFRRTQLKFQELGKRSNNWKRF